MAPREGPRPPWGGRDLRLFRDEECDLVFSCRHGRRIRTHQVILGKVSPFLHDLFLALSTSNITLNATGLTIEHTKNPEIVVCVPDVDAEDVVSLAEMLYESGEMVGSAEDVDKVAGLISLLGIRIRTEMEPVGPDSDTTVVRGARIGSTPRCIACQKTFSDECQLEQHLAGCSNSARADAGEILEPGTSSGAHEPTMRVTKGGIPTGQARSTWHRCKCGVVKRTLIELRLHILSIHFPKTFSSVDRKSKRCPECKAKLPSVPKLLSHLSSAHSYVPQDKIQNWISTGKSRVQSVVESNSAETAQCNYCSKMPKVLSWHLVKEHYRELDIWRGHLWEEKRGNEDTSLYHCCHCSASCSVELRMKHHVYKEHRLLLEPITPTPEAMFVPSSSSAPTSVEVPQAATTVAQLPVDTSAPRPGPSRQQFNTPTTTAPGPSATPVLIGVAAPTSSALTACSTDGRPLIPTEAATRPSMNKSLSSAWEKTVPDGGISPDASATVTAGSPALNLAPPRQALDPPPAGLPLATPLSTFAVPSLPSTSRQPRINEESDVLFLPQPPKRATKHPLLIDPLRKSFKTEGGYDSQMEDISAETTAATSAVMSTGGSTAATVARIYPCTRCPKVYSNEGNLKSHKRLHAKNFTCMKCPWCKHVSTLARSFTSHLARHKDRRQHEEFYCGVDGCTYVASLGKVPGFERHLRSRHTKENSYKCRFCQYRLSSDISMREHENKHRERHFCLRCSRFVQFEVIAQHKARCNGEILMPLIIMP